MGKIIAFAGIKENLGVTTSVITIAEKISKITKEKVLIIDMNFKNPGIFKLLSMENYELPVKNIGKILSYAITEMDITPVIKNNTEQLKNSKVEVIFCNQSNKMYDYQQYKNFFNSIKNEYNYILIDTIIPILEQIKDFCENIFIEVDENIRAVNEIIPQYINKFNFSLIINKYTKSISLNKYNNMFKVPIVSLTFDKEIIINTNNHIFNTKSAELYNESLNEFLTILIPNYGFKKRKVNIIKKIFKTKEVKTTEY